MADKKEEQQEIQGDRENRAKTFTQDEVNAIVQRRIAEVERREEAHRITLQADLDAKTAEIQKRNEREVEACKVEIETLKGDLDDAVVAAFDALPESMSAPDKRDWLKKVSGLMPAQPPSKMPPTPVGKKKVEGQFVPVPSKVKPF